MLLRAAPAFSLLNTHGDNLIPFGSSASSSSSNSASSFLGVQQANRVNWSVVLASKGSNSKPLTGVVFEPFEEVKKELKLVPSVPQLSLARHKFTDECESAINEQIKLRCLFVIGHRSRLLSDALRVLVVLTVLNTMFRMCIMPCLPTSIVTTSLSRVSQNFFNESSEEEREHAEKLMVYQNKRGGKVKLQSILMPSSEFDHTEKGDALYAMELALSLEKLTNEKLLNLHNVRHFFSLVSLVPVATRNNDVQLADFVENQFLNEQVEAIKKIAEYVAQLRRVGKGHGVWHFDQMLLHDEAEIVA
ncbi:ferritin 3 [Actinidia rufa]|uniref:Ferritin n=1 Tax=Actinidia rufa TaxID=165716 RepID=A0A7J0E6L8_9ERIC|nr:ferritin 3 [Actinidia rufa]